MDQGHPETESSYWLSGATEEEGVGRGMTAHGYGISSGDNENVLKLDIGWWYNSMNILKKQRTVHLNI